MNWIRFTILSFLIFPAPFSSASQNLDWAKRVGGIGLDRGECISTDQEGNIYVTGFFTDTVDFDPGPLVLNHGFPNGGTFFLKLDPNGNLLWAISYPNPGHSFDSKSIGIDSAGNVFVAIRFQGTADFDAGAGNFSLTAQEMTDAAVMKLDPSGNFLWAKQFAGPANQMWTDLALDNHSNIYVTGSIFDSTDFDPGPGVNWVVPSDFSDAFFLKMDGNGDVLWVDHLEGAGYSTGESVDGDNLGNVWFSGLMEGTHDFDLGNGNFDVTPGGIGTGNFIARYGSDFSLRAAGTIDFASPLMNLKSDDLGNVYSVGNFHGTVDVDPGPGVFSLYANNLNGWTDGLVIKIDSTCQMAWAKQLQGNKDMSLLGLDVLPGSDVFLSGWSRDSVDFDPGPGTYYDIQGQSPNGFLLRLSDQGDFQWEGTSTGGIGTSIPFIALDHNGGFFAVGEFWDSVDFDPGPGTLFLSSEGNKDIVLQRFESQFSISVPLLTRENTSNIFPNPNSGEFYLEFLSPGLVDGKIQVFDLNGRLVYSQNKFFEKGLIRERVTIPSVSPGLYFYSLELGGKYSGKLLIRN